MRQDDAQRGGLQQHCIIRRDTPCNTVALAHTLTMSQTATIQTPCHRGDVSCRAGVCHRCVCLRVYGTAAPTHHPIVTEFSLFAVSVSTATPSPALSTPSPYLVGRSRRDIPWGKSPVASNRAVDGDGVAFLSFFLEHGPQW